MADVFSKAKRSEVMSRIQSRGNEATEVALARLLRVNKISGWRRHLEIRGRDRSPLRVGRLSAKRGAHGVTRLTFRVKPDFVFPKARLALFVDGCFWHGCPRHGTQPKGNRAFWKNKLVQNKARDRRVNRALRQAGWRVVRIWECALKKHPLNCLRRIQRGLRV